MKKDILSDVLFVGARGGTATRFARCMHSTSQKSIAGTRIFGVSWIEPRPQLFSPLGTKKVPTPLGSVLFLVREAGLEPARP